MINLAHLQSTLVDQFEGRITDIQIRHNNELHFQIARGEALNLAEVLHNEFQTRLVLMIANDRRSDKGVYEVHYLFANDARNWFVHATKELPQDDPQLDSMATFYLPASRLEREINDMFGIQAVGNTLSPAGWCGIHFGPKPTTRCSKMQFLPRILKAREPPTPFYRLREKVSMKFPLAPFIARHHRTRAFSLQCRGRDGHQSANPSVLHPQRG